MKPKDLKPFFSFSERRPHLESHVFFVPLFYHDYTSFKPLTFPEYFGNGNRVCIEYCSGNGDWIIAQAREQPEKNWVAVEKRFDRVRKIWSKLNNHGLTNLLIVLGEAFTFTHHYLKCQSIEEVFIHFPDPWPKRKHAKNRLIQPQFANELARVLKTDGQVTIVTDEQIYACQSAHVFCAHPQFIPSLPQPPHFKKFCHSYGNSWFEKLWREKGKEILCLQCLKR